MTAGSDNAPLYGRSLFEGDDVSQWRGFRAEEFPPGWTLRAGELVRAGAGGDIITRARFRSFDLTLEWKTSPGGNSGIFFHVLETCEHVWETGPEYQLLDDDRHPDGKNPLTSMGAAYGLYPPLGARPRPAGDWNDIRLTVHAGHVIHWLNGDKVVEYDLGSRQWEEKVALSKFAHVPHYGRSMEGHIALQDHGDWVAFRNVRIRSL